MQQDKIKIQILAALSHPEAEEGLYFNNFRAVFEEEERPVVNGSEEEVLTALKELVTEGRVKASTFGEETIFSLPQR